VSLSLEEQKQVELLGEALEALAERVIGTEPCGCGKESVALSLDTTKVRFDGGKVVLPAYYVLCAPCSAAHVEGGDA
jgi:hypothetical protein